MTRVIRVALAFVMLGLVVVPTGASADTEPEITAEHGIVVNADTGEILYDKGMNTTTAPASLTKLFTAAVALDSAPPDRLMTVDTYDLVGEASMGLVAGDEVTLRTLIHGMLLPSGNDAAMTIARNLGELPGDSPQQSVNRFMERMNATAERLGLSDTQFQNPHGLDQSGHQSTARDMAAITMYALRNDTIREVIGSPYYQGDGYEMYHANGMLSGHPGVIGGKTGITDNAGYCLIEVAQRNGQTIIAVILNSTPERWYADASTLLDYGFNVMASASVLSTGETISLTPTKPSPINTVPSSDRSTDRADLTVDRTGDTTAIVRPTDRPSESNGFSWQWPLASVMSMVAVLALTLHYPALIGLGSLVWSQSRGLSFGSPGTLALGGSAVDLVSSSGTGRRPRQARRRSRQPVSTQQPEQAWSASAEPDPERVVMLNAAETITARAVKMASRGEHHAALREFNRALETDAEFDLARCPGFWAMPPAGYIAAARAYAQRGREDDARSLLTVVKLSFGSYYDIRKAVDEALNPRP